MNDIILASCPVCRQRPKITGSQRGCAYCVISCKNILGDVHLQVVVSKASWRTALKCAKLEWNKQSRSFAVK